MVEGPARGHEARSRNVAGNPATSADHRSASPTDPLTMTEVTERGSQFHVGVGGALLHMGQLRQLYERGLFLDGQLHHNWSVRRCVSQPCPSRGGSAGGGGRHADVRLDHGTTDGSDPANARSGYVRSDMGRKQRDRLLMHETTKHLGKLRLQLLQREPAVPPLRLRRFPPGPTASNSSG